MKVTIVGSGYVGLVTGACLAEVGHEVMCIDLDQKRIAGLQHGHVPIYEPGLDDLIRSNTAAGRLFFSTSYLEGATFGEIQIIAVGTPPQADGSADLQYVLAAAECLARHMNGDRIVVTKSTVPVGTADAISQTIANTLAARAVRYDWAVVSNPEFLKEGAAIADFMRPDRIVIGVEDTRAEALMRELYKPFQRNHDRLITMSVRSAELTKYAANAMLATRISFMNDIANLAEHVGADIEEVRKGIGSDSRIGYSFLYAGTGYGGSCFPKDVQALIETAHDNDQSLQILEAVRHVNERQKSVLARKLLAHYQGDISGKRFALWGLTFKPDTDDLRDAPSLVIIDELLRAGATIQVYDPIATSQLKALYKDCTRLIAAPHAMAAAQGVDALLIATEWKAFRAPDFGELRRSMKSAVIFDGRNLYDPDIMAERGFDYQGIGRSRRHLKRSSEELAIELDTDS